MSADLIKALEAYTVSAGGENPFVTAIPGVTILRSEHPKPPMPRVHRASLCLVAQGAKRGVFGDTQLEYRAGQALIVGIETPTVGWVAQATPAEPFLGMIVEFDLVLMRDVLAEIGAGVRAIDTGGVFVASIGEELDDCALRLVRLLGRPQAIPTIAPLIMRELSYWLLSAPYGNAIAAMIGGQGTTGIVAAIDTLRTRFAETLRTQELARTAQMSESTFHRQFKIVTSMTPLQYQKQLRLLEARHLMIGNGANAETAAFSVGYESQSQFSREYARMFGAPPRRDIVALREITTLEA